MEKRAIETSMKARTVKLSGLYLAALRIHLERDSPAGMASARDMGRRSLAIGLETLDMAKMHENALATLMLPDCLSARLEDMTLRASKFFTEAITPIEKTHRTALETDLELNRMSETLKNCTKDLADSNSELQQQITGRLTAEAAFNTNEAASGRLLKDSRLLEKQLQDMARRILSANEDERKKMSLHLHDEIAQTLLGIHVRLLALKREASANSASLGNEIAATRRLVAKSVKLISRLSHQIGTDHDSQEN